MNESQRSDTPASLPRILCVGDDLCLSADRRSELAGDDAWQVRYVDGPGALPVIAAKLFDVVVASAGMRDPDARQILSAAEALQPRALRVMLVDGPAFDVRGSDMAQLAQVVLTREPRTPAPIVAILVIRERLRKQDDAFRAETPRSR